MIHHNNNGQVTYDQYLAAKRIVEAYEGDLESDEDFDDDRDHLSWEEEQERQEEENLEIAASCKCGAWVVGKSGKAIHVADCCCGAE